MKIGGFVKQSLIDYPGKVASVIFTRGCNFRCGYCHNPQLVLPELFREDPAHSPINILHYLNKHKNWLDGVVVTGGEPTIQKDLPDFLKELKAYGYSVKLDTNGSNPFMLEEIINNKLADYIAMDVKTIPEQDSYAEITGVRNAREIVENVLVSIILLKQSGILTEFRTTSIPGIHNDQTLDAIRKIIGTGHPYILNEFRDGVLIGGFGNYNNTDSDQKSFY